MANPVKAAITASVKMKTKPAGFVMIERILNKLTSKRRAEIPNAPRAFMYIFSFGRTEKSFSILVFGLF